MNYRQGAVAAGILLFSATLTACGDGASSSSSAANLAKAPALSNRASPLRPGSSTASASSTDTGAAGAHTGTATSLPGSSEPQALTLSWTAPTENADGSPLVDLSGYKIRYGTSPGDYTETVTLSNAGLNRYVVDNLTTGTYYFTISAYNSAGTESQLSGELSTTI